MAEYAEKAKFYYGACDFCDNTFAVVKKLHSGKWACMDCLDALAIQSNQEYQDVLGALWEEGITAKQLLVKLEAILLLFKYNYNLLTPREKRRFEQEIKRWEGETEDENGD